MAEQKGQTQVPWPEDGHYRGIEIPGRLKANWNNVSGRWWKQGVDDVIDGSHYKALVEDSWRYGDLNS